MDCETGKWEKEERKIDKLKESVSIRVQQMMYTYILV